MVWQRGQSGNPLGRTSEKIVADAIRVAALTVIESGRRKGWTKLRAMAEAVVDKAVAGDLSAFAMIADRLDGKPMQQSESKIETSASELFLQILRSMQSEVQDSGAKQIEHSANGQDQSPPSLPWMAAGN